MLEQGFWKIDPHAHSIRSDGSISLVERATLAYQAGLDGYGETDHDVWARDEEPYDELIPRLKGVEVTTGMGHLLVYAPKGTDPKKIPMGYSLVETVRRVQGEGYKVIVPHMNFGPIPASVSLNALRRLYDAGYSVNGIEAEHTFYTKKHRSKAKSVAREFNIAEVGTGDDHTGNIGRRFYTLIPCVSNDPIADFYLSLENRTSVPIKSELDLLPTPSGKNAFRHIRALFVGLPAKVICLPRFAHTVAQYYMEELRRR